MKFKTTKYQFRDIATFHYGKMPKKDKVLEMGKYPIYSGYRYVGYYDEYNVDAGTLIVIARGVGGTGDVKITKEKCYLTNLSIAVEITNRNKVLPEYLYYQYKLNNLRYLDSGSAQSQITISDLEKIPIQLPSIVVQRKIVDSLSIIDRKIDISNEINKNLEEQAQLFYKKFDSNSQAWREGTVGEVVTLQRGYDLPKTKMIKGKYPVAGSTDTIFYHNQYMAEPPCIVLGRSGNIGKPRLYLEPCWPHNTSLFTKQFKNSNPLWVYFMLYNLDYSMFQGGSAVPTLNRNHIHSYAIKIPPIAEQNKFAQTIEPLIKAIFHNRKEIETLSKLRDTLLPRLMSGEIDVSCVS